MYIVLNRYIFDIFLENLLEPGSIVNRLELIFSLVL